MITKTKGKKFNGDIITLRDGKSIGCCDTTQELLDMVDGNKEIIKLIELSFKQGISHENLNNKLQDIVDSIIDVSWNDEIYRPQSQGYQGKDMYPKYVMECLKKGVQDYDTMKKFGLVKYGKKA